MLRNLNRSSGGRRILGTPNVGLLASQIISETATGDNGAGMLYNEALANPGKQLRIKITSYNGTSSALFVHENGSLTVIGEADGGHTIGYNWEGFNPDGSGFVSGSDTASIVVGIVNASALAGTGTSTGSGVGGTAAGQQTGNASGGTGTSVGSGVGGVATPGTVAGVANGGIGLSTGSGTGGSATVTTVSGNAFGGIGLSTGSGTGGSAVGGSGGMRIVSLGTTQSNEVYLNDIGTKLNVDCDEDLTEAITTSLMVMKPDGTVIEWSTTIFATGVSYVTQAGDLNVAGEWRLQPKVVSADWSGRCDIVTLTVLPIIEVPA